MPKRQPGYDAPSVAMIRGLSRDLRSLEKKCIRQDARIVVLTTKVSYLEGTVENLQRKLLSNIEEE